MPKIQLNFKHFFLALAISSFLLSFLFVFYSKTFAATGINRTINFQGKLVTNPQGTNVSDTTYTVVFTFYDNATGANTALWTETQTVTTADGIFRVALGSVTPFPANFNFNWSGLYLGIKVNSDPEMTPRIQMAAVPFAFNAEKVAGLTVQDSSGSTGSTSATLKIGTSATNPITVDLGLNNVTFNTGSYSNGQTLTFTSSGTTSVTLPSSGTLLTNTAAANQTVTSTQTTGTLLGLTDSTGLSGAITGLAITLSGTGAQDQTGLSFNLSGATGTNLNDIVGTGSSWKISKAGALTVASCSGCGGVGSTNYWGLTSGGTTGGLLYNGNQTTDFAIGGVSTTSALFSYTGVLSGHTIASASGNLALMPNNGWGGQVGIGTTLPTANLHITSSGQNQLKLETTNSNSYAVGRWVSPTKTFQIALGAGSSPSFANDFYIYDETATHSRLVIDTNGNVIIGSDATTALGALTLTGSVAGGDASALALYNSAGGANASVSLDFYSTSVNGGIPTAKIKGLDDGNYSNNLLFFTKIPGASGNALAERARLTSTGLFGIGTTSPLSTFDVRPNTANGGTISIASVSGITSFASLVANNDGVGDLFTASKSGLALFTVKNNGQLVVGAPYYQTGACTLKTDTTGLVTCGTDLTGGSGVNWLNELAGALSPVNTTDDFLLGSTATSSALFSYTGVKTGRTIASASGNLILMANNGWGGQLGINTTNPVYPLDVNGQGRIGNGLAQEYAGYRILNVNSLTTDTTQNIYNIGGTLSVNVSGSSSQLYYAGLFNTTTSTGNTANITGRLVGFAGQADHNGTGTITEMRGFSGAVQNVSTGIISTAYGGKFTILNAGAGTYTNAYGLYVSSPTNGTGGNYFNNYGLYIADQSNVGWLNSYNIWSDGVKSKNYFAGQVGIGNSASPSAALQIFSESGIQPVASVSGITSFASLVANNDGVGDLFTASKSGLALFTVKNNGQLVVGAPYYQTGACTLKTDTTGLVTCGTDLQGGGGGGGYSPFQEITGVNGGVIAPNNSTMDFLIGGQSTSSAKFAFGNLNSGVPTATFSGELMMEAQANSSVYDQTNWQKISSATPGTIGGGGTPTTQIASISAMAVYNGSLYVGTYKNPSGTAGSAEVYRYDGTGTSWTKVSQATAGTIAEDVGSTTGIASVSAMTVFDGYLYVGTSKINAAEIYRYDGGTSWTKVSAPTAGTIGCTVTSCTATANINGVTSLAVYQGALYAGTQEPAAAQLYRYVGGISWTLINTTTIGTFVTTNTVKVDAITNMVVKNGFLYLGMLRPGDADVLRYSGGEGTGASTTFLSMNLGSATGSYSINGNAVTTFDEVTAMTVYNGAVIVALRRGNNQADVLRLNDGMQSGTTSPNSWTRLNNAVGQMTNGGTQNIDSITSLVVYNGFLYAGTNEANNAEIYRYTGTDQKWFEVTQPTAGQIASGGTQNINAVTRMVATNGDLYAGTMEDFSAEVYRLSNVNINKSYAIKFHAAPSIAGGEQGTVDNYASIFYLASASANLSNSAGNTGAFIFSHGIQTRNGSYDVAEDYATRDDTLKPGDVVAIDPNERGFIKKTSGAYDNNVIGVFSSNPALRLSQSDAFINGGYAVPIALAGRVPVKVSTESGAIKPGDYLTPSSVPGIAMKALKSSVVFAQAMEGYSGEEGGQVLSYIKSMTYQGAIADNFANLDTNSSDFAVNVLDRIKTQNVTDGKSDIITDRLIAGLEIITPKVSATEVNLDEINVLSGTDISLNLSEDGKFMIKNSSGSAGITFDANGNAYFSGLVFADKIKANQIEGLEIFTNQISSLKSQVSNLETSSTSAVLGVSSESARFDPSLLTLSSLNVEGLATVSADLNVKGSGFFQGALNVLEGVTTQNLLVSQFAYFINDVVFKGNVRFNQAPTFSKDTAGFAVIKKGDDAVTVTYDQEYNQMPVVTASIVLDKTDDNILQKQLEDSVLNGNVTYVITQRTTKGFVVRLGKPAPEDLNFSWVALSVKDAKTSGVNPTLSPNLSATPSAGVQSILNLLNNSPGPPN